jgi:methionyl-tRNA formyltransferase
MTLRVAYFGSSQNVFSQRFYEALAHASCDIVGIVDVPPAKRSSTNAAKDDGKSDYPREAARCGIPVYEPGNPNLPEFVETMRSLRPDLFLAVGYMFRLQAEMLAAARIVSANVHASLLPAYRGRSPVFWALRRGEPYSGLSIHSMDDGLDTGDLLYQVRVRTRKDDTVSALYARIIDRGVKLVPRLITDAERGRLPRKSQAGMPGSYFSAVKEGDFRLDWSRSAEQLRRWIVTTPGECFSDFHGNRLFLRDARLAPNPHMAAPGTLLRIASTGCHIATGDCALRIVMVRPSSGEPMPMSHWCRQMRLSAGDSVVSIAQEASPKEVC